MWKKILSKLDLQNIYIRVSLGVESLNKIAKDYDFVSYEAIRQAMEKYNPLHQYVVVWNKIMRLSDKKKFHMLDLPELHQKIVKFTLYQEKWEKDMVFVKF